MRSAPLTLLLGLAALGVAGCGDGGGGGDGGDERPRTAAAVKACLEREGPYKAVDTYPAGKSATSGLTDNERREVVEGMRGHGGAIVATAGGPEDRDGAIVEIPIRGTELYLFPDAAAAKEAAGRLDRFVDSPLSPAVNGVRVLGPIVVVHYSYGVDGEGTEPLDAEEIAPVEECLRQSGYL